ncbi:MAG: amino acid permease [Rhodanobacteraceae bacterium]|nr:amino acid permease [Rhodanobacteraceae bacterium]
MAEQSGVTYTKVDKSYFEKRGLRRYAGVWSLWALGVGAVISGHFSGWNLGLANGWGSMLLATGIIAVMYLGLTFSLAEMSPALPHTGGAYSFARTAMGPWGGFLTGLSENVEYVLTPAVIVFFIGSYMGGIFETAPQYQPLWWIGFYVVFVILNVVGVELSFKVTVAITLLALACLVVFWVSALPHIDFNLWAMNVPAGGVAEGNQALAEGGGPFLPKGFMGVLAAMPFAVWLFLAIEQLPLAAEESVDPKRDMPRGIIAGIFTLIVSAFLILWLNSSVVGIGAYKLATSGEPLLDGFKAIYGDGIAKTLALVAVLGLVASFHTIIFAKGRQIYSLSRAGYFPSGLSITHGSRKTPHVAMVLGSVVALAVMFVLWFSLGSDKGAAVIGGTLLNMAVFGAMFSYIMQGLSFILLRSKLPNMERPYRSPMGVAGAVLTVVIALVTLYFQLTDPVYRTGVVWVAGWFALGILYFALVGRHRLILSPEEEFAMTASEKTARAH